QAQRGRVDNDIDVVGMGAGDGDDDTQLSVAFVHVDRRRSGFHLSGPRIPRAKLMTGPITIGRGSYVVKLGVENCQNPNPSQCADTELTSVEPLSKMRPSLAPFAASGWPVT